MPYLRHHRQLAGVQQSSADASGTCGPVPYPDMRMDEVSVCHEAQDAAYKKHMQHQLYVLPASIELMHQMINVRLACCLHLWLQSVDQNADQCLDQ